MQEFKLKKQIKVPAVGVAANLIFSATKGKAILQVNNSGGKLTFKLSLREDGMSGNMYSHPEWSIVVNEENTILGVRNHAEYYAYKAAVSGIDAEISNLKSDNIDLRNQISELEGREADEGIDLTSDKETLAAQRLQNIDLISQKETEKSNIPVVSPDYITVNFQQAISLIDPVTLEVNENGLAVIRSLHSKPLNDIFGNYF